MQCTQSHQHNKVNNQRHLLWYNFLIPQAKSEEQKTFHWLNPSTLQTNFATVHKNQSTCQPALLAFNALLAPTGQKKALSTKCILGVVFFLLHQLILSHLSLYVFSCAQKHHSSMLQTGQCYQKLGKFLLGQVQAYCFPSPHTPSSIVYWYLITSSRSTVVYVGVG